MCLHDEAAAAAVGRQAGSTGQSGGGIRDKERI